MIMAGYRNQYANHIYVLLMPLVGEFMAHGILKAQTKKMNMDAEALDQKSMPVLAEGIRVGLITFLGSQAAQKVSMQIKAIT
jgi:hypothetical protein